MWDFSNIQEQSFVLTFLFIGGFLSGYILRWVFAGRRLKEAKSKAKTLIDSAKKEAESRKNEVELHGKDLVIKLRQDFEQETKDRREELLGSEKRIAQQEL